MSEYAQAERLNRTIKEEFLQNRDFEDLEAARLSVHRAVSAFNVLRPHASINHLTPDQACRTNGLLPRCWKNYYTDKPKPFPIPP